MRAVIDYRPALRERSGVGEYTHQLVRGLLRVFGTEGADPSLELSVFSSSWKDRLILAPDLGRAVPIDRWIPVKLLNFTWHRLGWPAAETLMGRPFDVAHSMHPLLMPSRSAAQVVTIHDLNFLTHPERTGGEIRRDYPSLARDHAHRADRIIVPSHFTAEEVVRLLEVPSQKIAVCWPGAPEWTARKAPPVDGYLLFFGTLEPRKNVGALLDAYERLLAGATADAPQGGRQRSLPELVLAGKATTESQPWLERIEREPLKGFVRHIGYVDPANRRALYGGARLLVQPSFEEGFGLTVLEAMVAGVPVVAANRGALPEVLGDAGTLVDPDDPSALAAAIVRTLDDDTHASSAIEKGLRRAARFTWEATARNVFDAYLQAIEHRRCGSA